MDQTGRIAADAIVLTGGRGSRLGCVDKPQLEVGGRTLLDGAIDALRGMIDGRIFVAGPCPDQPDPEVRWVREEPPFGGPVAGIAAALPLVQEPVVFLIAGDLVSPAEAVRLLSPSAGADAGAQLRDPGGRPQPLAAVYRTAALRSGLAVLPRGGRDASMRRLLHGMPITMVDADAEATRDIDTWEDLEEARRRVPGGGNEHHG